MAAGTTPVFTQVSSLITVAYGTAETARAAPTNKQDIYTGDTDGTLVHGISFKSTVTTTAGMIRVWHVVGGTYFLIGEVPVSAVTPSATVAAWEGYWTPPIGPWVLQSGQKIAFSTEKAENFNATLIGADFS